MNPIFDMRGKTALVTGASSGMGSHFARVLAEHGAQVVLSARRTDRLEALAEEICAGRGRVLAVPMDLTSADSVCAVFDAAEQAFGVVNVVSNNAGVADARMALDIEEAAWDRVLEINLKGAWRVAMVAASRLVRAGLPGCIVNTASILGLRTAIGQSSYATSKAGLLQLTRSLALEWARKKIRVNALCPGYFVTEMTQGFLATDRGKAYLATTPAQRVGEMEELTAPFLLLASDAGSFINGVALPVDGAQSIGNM